MPWKGSFSTAFVLPGLSKLSCPSRPLTLPPISSENLLSSASVSTSALFFVVDPAGNILFQSLEFDVVSGSEDVVPSYGHIVRAHWLTAELA